MSKRGYNYQECGLPNVWLLNGYHFEKTPYGKGVNIQDLEGLHRCIAQLLVDKPDPLTGAEFRFLRLELDLSQRWLGELFGKEERQVRNWETAAEVSEPYNRMIRHIYLERIDPSSSFEGLFERLRSLDVAWHERMQFIPDQDGNWQSAA